MRQSIQGLQYVAATERDLAGDMGVTIQNQNGTVPGDDMYHALSGASLTFTPFDPYGVSSQWIDIFSMGIYPFGWNITSNASFVSFSQSAGSLSPTGTQDVRIYATVDWKACPPGAGMVMINVTSNPPMDNAYEKQTRYGTQYNMPQLVSLVYRLCILKYLPFRRCCHTTTPPFRPLSVTASLSPTPTSPSKSSTGAARPCRPTPAM